MSEKSDISSALSSVAKKWKAEKRKADKNDRLSTSQYRRFYVSKTSMRESAFEHMEEAYNKASANGKYYANARQIYYAIRPLILADVDQSKLDGNYFSQTLLKDYLELYNPQGWKVVWDARGHFEEPHTGKRIGVGGIEVEKYMRSWTFGVPQIECSPVDDMTNTKGPANRFNSVLFIEKEGFNEILQDAEIGKKYDMAIISTKGMPVKAACDLLSQLQKNSAQIFILHDFDKSGFTILKTLRMGTRMAYGFDFTDLGLRLEDIKGLPSEEVSERTSYYKACRHLKECGATEEEINFLVSKAGVGGWSGKRVELNAMMSDEFIEWLEKKLKKHEVKKVIPNKMDLTAAYRRACLGQRIEEIVKEERDEFDDQEVPEDLKNRVVEHLKAKPTDSWDKAVWDIADED